MASRSPQRRRNTWPGHLARAYWKVTQLTNNDYQDSQPQVHGSNVVWFGHDESSGGDRELFLYDGSSTTQLTSNIYQESSFQIHGSKVVWLGYDGHDEEVFLAHYVPEPSTFIIWSLLGALGVTVGWWRRRRAAQTTAWAFSYQGRRACGALLVWPGRGRRTWKGTTNFHLLAVSVSHTFFRNSPTMPHRSGSQTGIK